MSMVEINGKPKAAIINAELVPNVKAVVQEIKEREHIETNFTQVVNKLVHDALEARKVKSETS